MTENIFEQTKGPGDCMEIDQEIVFADGSKVTFVIRDISQEERKLLLSQCKSFKKILGKQEDDILDRYDWEKFNMLLVRKCVAGWTGLQNRHLTRIYECQGKPWEYKGDKKAETEVPFTTENLRELSEVYNQDFFSYFQEALKQIREHFIHQKEQELKN